MGGGLDTSASKLSEGKGEPWGEFQERISPIRTSREGEGVDRHKEDPGPWNEITAVQMSRVHLWDWISSYFTRKNSQYLLFSVRQRSSPTSVQISRQPKTLQKRLSWTGPWARDSFTQSLGWQGATGPFHSLCQPQVCLLSGLWGPVSEWPSPPICY